MQEISNQYQILKGYVAGQRDWQNTKIHQVNLSSVILKGINLGKSYLVEVNLESCNLEGANLKQGIFERCNFTNSRLKKANFSQANLNSASLQDAFLESTKFKQANLSDADLTGAYLYRADLRGTCLKGAKLDGAFLVGAIYDENTIFDPDFFILDTGMIYQPSYLARQKKNAQVQKKKLSISRTYRGVCYESHLKAKTQVSRNSRLAPQAIKYRGAYYDVNLEAKTQAMIAFSGKTQAIKYRGISCSNVLNDRERKAATNTLSFQV